MDACPDGEFASRVGDPAAQCGMHCGARGPARYPAYQRDAMLASLIPLGPTTSRWIQFELGYVAWGQENQLDAHMCERGILRHPGFNAGFSVGSGLLYVRRDGIWDPTCGPNAAYKVLTAMRDPCGMNRGVVSDPESNAGCTAGSCASCFGSCSRQYRRSDLMCPTTGS